MKQGEDAVRRMADIDQSSGMQTPAEVARRQRENKTRDAKVQQPLMASNNDALGDQTLANNLRQQAARMAVEAKGLMAESQDLLKQAAEMDPPVIEKKPRASKKSVVVEAPVATPAAKVKKPRAKVSA